MRFFIGFLALIAALCGCRAPDDGPPRRIPRDDAYRHMITRVQAEPVAGVYANSVTADIVIGTNGGVESVTVLKGDQRQAPSAIAALMNYRFSPIVLDGRPRRVITTVVITVPDTFATSELAAGSDTSAAVDVRGRPEVVLTADCNRATKIYPNPAKAVDTCIAALRAVNELPENELKLRVDAHSALGDAYLLTRRWPDAIREFEAALRIERPLEAKTYRRGERLGKISVGYFNLGDLTSADHYAGLAVTTMRAAMPADPNERAIVMRTLRELLLMQARFKRLHSDEIGARRLEHEAEGLAVQER